MLPLQFTITPGWLVRRSSLSVCPSSLPTTRIACPSSLPTTRVACLSSLPTAHVFYRSPSCIARIAHHRAARAACHLMLLIGGCCSLLGIAFGSSDSFNQAWKMKDNLKFWKIWFRNLKGAEENLKILKI